LNELEDVMKMTVVENSEAVVFLINVEISFLTRGRRTTTKRIFRGAYIIQIFTLTEGRARLRGTWGAFVVTQICLIGVTMGGWFHDVESECRGGRLGSIKRQGSANIVEQSI